MRLFQLLLVFLCNIGCITCGCCPDGWLPFQASCYLFGRHHASSFTEAETYCRQHQDAHLIEIETDAENEFIKDFLRGLKGESYWMGLTDEQTEGVWLWYSSKTVPMVTGWHPGEPNNYHRDEEDCAAFGAPFDYDWIDETCHEKNEPLCEMRIAGELVG